MLRRYAKSNWHNLPPEEQRANRIDIYRSIDSYDCGFACFEVDSVTETFHQLEDGLKYGENDIFTKWETIWDMGKTIEAVEKYGETFQVELEVVYLSWLVQNWMVAKQGIPIHLQYCITENNSQRSFDLNLLHWDIYMDVYNYQQYLPHFHQQVPKETILRNRILLDFLGNEVTKLTRILQKDNHQMVFHYEESSIKVSDNRDRIYFESDFKQASDKYIEQYRALKKMVSDIELLRQQGYQEVIKKW